MSFIEYADCFVWQCDGCELRVEFPPRNFWSCKDELKGRGWGFYRDEQDGGWFHHCAKCVQKAKKENVGNVSILDRPIKRRPVNG
jgi:hypothetical protein